MDVTWAGRRSYKTELNKRRAIVRAILHSTYENYRIAFGAPTREQAKAIFWEDLKAMIPSSMLARRPREQELSIRLKHGPTLQVAGLDKAERKEGIIYDEWVIDEIDECKPHVWWTSIYPGLVNEARVGRASLFSVPRRLALLKELSEEATKDETGKWSGYHWKSAEVVDPEIIAERRSRMDPVTFRREYEASFETIGQRAYYRFDRRIHAAQRLIYDPERPLILCFDFNVDPGTASILQEQQRATYRQHGIELPGAVDPTFLAVIGEVYIPSDSYTPIVCRKIESDWGHHKGDVFYSGDQTGGARHSDAPGGSNWKIIKEMLGPVFRGRFLSKIPRKNPDPVDRIIAVNSRLMNTDDRVRMLVDPSCAEVIKDLEGVGIRVGSAGEPDERPGPRGHLMAGMGYYIHERWPVSGHAVTVTNQFGELR